MAAEDHCVVFAQGLDKGPDFHDLLGVQPHRGLIQDHHLRVPQQGLGNAHPLLVSLGEVLDEPVGYRLDLGNRHDPAHLFLQGAPRQALGLSHKGEVFQRRPVQVEGRPLGQVANAPLGLGRILKDIVSPHRDLPLRGRQAACHNVHGGGFTGQAGAIRHGISRALLQVDGEFRSTLKKAGFLTRDPRMKERKKPGLRKARRAPQFSKR